ncbi:hypothetical protein K661_00178 [Piscirickettsia salmonis LF-89 = ATCC VR-1361]|nr:hypothetical protein K661_00178 [Piscirickettsia salmonis LF-89 = ATCC VR-1361]
MSLLLTNHHTHLKQASSSYLLLQTTQFNFNFSLNLGYNPLSSCCN